MTKQESYAEKIDKLLRKAESTSPEEAEALIAKAQELMTKYAIDEAMLNSARMKRGEQVSGEIVQEEFVMTGSFRVALGNLCFYIMLVNDCQAVLIQNSPRTVAGKVYKQTYILRAVGYQSDIDRVRMLYTSLQLQGLRFQSEWWRKNRAMYEDTGQDRQGFLDRRQFLFSYADRIAVRLREGQQAGQAAAAKEHGTGMELVLRDKKQMVKDEYEKRNPNLRTAKQRQAGGSYESARAGSEAANRADLGGTKFGGDKKRIGK